MNSTETPDRIRVAQDADGFWTSRKAESDSQEYIRIDQFYDALDVLLDLVVATGNGGTADLRKKALSEALAVLAEAGF